MIIVTGASRGLGRAIADRLIKRGEEVLGLSRSEVNSSFASVVCDVTSYSSIRSVAKDLKDKGHQVDAVINVAGIASMNMAVTTDEFTVKNLIETNLIGTIYSCQLFAPLMMRQKSGVIINFSTIAVPLALKGESVYAASKAGVETFSRAFAREVSDFNIRVNCIAPGPIPTDLLNGVSDQQINNIISSQVIRRRFEKSDVCDLIEILLDPRASALSGQSFNLGGV